MAEQDGRSSGGTAAPTAAPAKSAVSGPLGAALLAFEQVAVTGEAARVRDAAADTAAGAAGLVAALGEASEAAPMPAALLTGPALAECAALLARRAREFEAESERTADAMTRAAGLLVVADEEVARRVGGAAG